MTTEAIIPQLVVRVWNSREATHIRLEDDIGNSLMDSSFSEVSNDETQRIVAEAVRRSNAFPSLVAAATAALDYVENATSFQGTEAVLAYQLGAALQGHTDAAGHAPAPPEAQLLHVLTLRAEFDVTPLQWLTALIAEVEDTLDLDRHEDPEAISRALDESRALVNKLNDLVALRAAGAGVEETP